MCFRVNIKCLFFICMRPFVCPSVMFVLGLGIVQEIMIPVPIPVPLKQYEYLVSVLFHTVVFFLLHHLRLQDKAFLIETDYFSNNYCLQTRSDKSHLFHYKNAWAPDTRFR